MLWRELRDRYGEYFEGGMGADALKQLIDRLDLDEEEIKLRTAIDPPDGQRPLSAQRKQKAIKRLKIVSAFNRRDDHGRRVNDPRAMILDVVPVIPPELRPMVQLDGGRFATSDLNDLYRRVINRNNRLKRLLDLGAPEIIVNNEKRMLQEAVDALFDNGRRGRPVTGPGNRPLKSLSDMLKGKQGRFRQNLLGKRVDYSGRSVIVVGPTLKLHQCGLPKLMALELFKPFVMKALVDRELAQNIKSAKRMVERRRPQVWDVLEDVIKEHPVLLNRAPTLHRLGIQAFEPVLVEGKAIQIHPLVCTAFNADFDGDQMAVHLPLSAEAQAECPGPDAVGEQHPVAGARPPARHADPGHGHRRLLPHRAGRRCARRGPGRSARLHEVERAYDKGDLALHATIIASEPDGDEPARDDRRSAGRSCSTRLCPRASAASTESVRKRHMGEIVDRLANELHQGRGAEASTTSRISASASPPGPGSPSRSRTSRRRPRSAASSTTTRRKPTRSSSQFRRGIITDGERRQKEVEIWTNATDEVREAMERGLSPEHFNPIDMMVGSGARGNMMQVRQIAGMRGLVANPRGDMIPRPIKSQLPRGPLDARVLHRHAGCTQGPGRHRPAHRRLRLPHPPAGRRRPGADHPRSTTASPRATRSAASGSKTSVPTRPASAPTSRRGSSGARWRRTSSSADGTVARRPAPRSATRSSRPCATTPTSTGCACARSLTCQADLGVCGNCYGRSLATGRTIELGEAVGVIAAQSIGEPGTQLTMRTFHTGGIAGSDIAGGLPRVVELFEARSPRGKATLARTSGVVRVADDEGKGRVITIVGDDGNEETHTVPTIARLEVVEGQEITAGDAIVEGPRDPKELLEIKGVRETQQYLVNEVQKVYRDQGVSIHDKHIELIVRQMTRRVAVQEPGDSHFLPGERVDARRSTPTSTARWCTTARSPPRAGPRSWASPRRRWPPTRGCRRRRSRRPPGSSPRRPSSAAATGSRPQGEHHHRQADPRRARACPTTATSRPRHPTTSPWSSGRPIATSRTSPPGWPRTSMPPPRTTEAAAMSPMSWACRASRATGAEKPGLEPPRQHSQASRRWAVSSLGVSPVLTVSLGSNSSTVVSAPA